jgi:hypothetical protein
MKTTKLRWLAVCTLVLGLLLALPALASAATGDQFVVDGQRYEVLVDAAMPTEGTVKIITWGADGYVGTALAVPDKVTDPVGGSDEYFVTEIGDWIPDNSATGILSVDLSAVQHMPVINSGLRNLNRGIQTIILPPSVVTLGDYALGYMSSTLTTVDLSNCSNLTTLGNCVFQASAGIAALDFSATQIAAFPAWTFQNSSGLTALIPPATLQTIGSNSLQGTNITALDLSSTILTTIDGWAFLESGLGSLILPTTIQTIGANAFQDNLSLTAVTFAGPSDLQTIGTWAFHGDAALSNFDFSALGTAFNDFGWNAFEGADLQTVNLANASTLNSIAGYVFAGNLNLQTVTLPASILLISDGAFVNAASLATVNFADLVNLGAIGDYAFANNALTSITAPASLGWIGEGAFATNPALTTLDLSAAGGLTYLSENAFIGASALKTVKFPAALTEIGVSAFAGTTSLERVQFASAAVPELDADAFVGAPVAGTVQFPVGSTVYVPAAFTGTPLETWLFTDGVPPETPPAENGKKPVNPKPPVIKPDKDGTTTPPKKTPKPKPTVCPPARPLPDAGDTVNYGVIITLGLAVIALLLVVRKKEDYVSATAEEAQETHAL